MGIRFLCQHCHRHLNVKTVQAGMKGECPYCGQSIVVPLESNPDSPGLDYGSTQGTVGSVTSGSVVDVDKQLTETGLTPSIHLSTNATPAGFGEPESSTGRAVDTLALVATESDTLFLLDKPQLPTTLGKIDPIEEAPRNVWYYRSNQLGEKGPLKAKAMREELNNGNVTIGCIVWRDDWEDWQAAERVFPSLVALMSAERERSSPTGKRLVHDKLNPHSARDVRKRKMQLLGLAAIAIGLLIVAALVGFLSYLVSN